MIKLKKAKQPDVLAEKAQQWTDEYLEALSKGVQVKFHYNHSEIKQRLIDETNGKCAYCESLIHPASFGDIEHILPKKARPELCYDWDNLTFACEVCNRTQKKDYYDPNLPLINPYLDDPDAHLLGLGAFIWPKSNTDMRAEKTVEILDLNRVHLLERRKEKLAQIDVLLEVWRSAQLPHYIKNRVEGELEEMVSEKKEYLLIAKAYLRAEGFPV